MVFPSYPLSLAEQMTSVPNERNAILMDTHRHAFFYRSKRATFMTLEFQKQLWNGIQTLLRKDLGDEELRRHFKNGPRGTHFPCIMGHAQQYQKVSFYWIPFFSRLLLNYVEPRAYPLGQKKQGSSFSFSAAPCCEGLGVRRGLFISLVP